MTALSYQLYSSRNFPPLADTLSMLAGIGYREVEGFGGLFDAGADLARLRDMLDQNGLTMPTCHVGLDEIEGNPVSAIERAGKLGVERVYVPFLMPEARPTDAAGWRAFGQRLAEAGKPVRDAGLDFGWHNHDFEFRPVDGDVLPIDLLLGASDDLSFEFDVAWAVRAGADPMNWIDRYAGRITSAHVKDIAAPGTCLDEDGWADVGHGTLDWAGLMAALRAAGTRHFIVEHDNPADHKRFAEQSFAAITSFGEA